MTDRRRLIETRQWRPTRARIATLLIFLANGSGIGAWAGTIPRLKLALQLSDTQLGVAMLAVAAGAIVSMPLAGRYGTRFPSHRVTGLAALTYGAFLVLPGQASGLAGLIAACLAFGAVNGVMDVSMNGHASIVERVWGDAIMSSFHAAFSLGGFTGALFVSLCVRAGIGPGTTLVIVAGWVISLGLLAAGVRLAAPLPPPLRHSESASGRPVRGILAGLCALTFAAMFLEGSTADWAGVFLVTVAGAPVATGAAVYAGFSVAMVIGRLLGDRIVRALGRPGTLRVGALVAAAGVTLALATATRELAALGFGLVGLGVANIIPSLFSAAGRARPDAPALGVSHAATVGYTGFMIGPPLVGAVADHIGLRLSLAALPVAALLIAAGASLARDR